MASRIRLYRPELHEEATCSTCGKVYERRWMEELNTGRSKQLLCPECYHKATMDIYASRTEKVERMNKIKRTK